MVIAVIRSSGEVVRVFAPERDRIHPGDEQVAGREHVGLHPDERSVVAVGNGVDDGRVAGPIESHHPGIR